MIPANHGWSPGRVSVEPAMSISIAIACHWEQGSAAPPSSLTSPPYQLSRGPWASQHT